jgi:two-component system response regulator AtoC
MTMPTPAAKTHMLSFTLDDLTSENPAMRRCLALAREGAKSELPILLQGETGTGKTLLAQAIHNSSPRRPREFLSFNASAMSDTLLESQLFGHEKGAFTGATVRMRGKFEMADGGTLFFDEIADMSALAQAKILRAVEYGEYERLGSELMHYADVRIISATNRSLRTLVAANQFREDLYHRLNGLTLLIPPLRDRREDLPALIAAELQQCAESAGKTITAIEPAAFAKLLAYPWPGNLRELHRVIQATVLFAETDAIRADDVILDESLLPPAAPAVPAPPPAATPFAPAPLAPAAAGATSPAAPAAPLGSPADLTLETATLRHTEYVYQMTGRNKRRTAMLLGVSRSTLDRKLEALARLRQTP